MRSENATVQIENIELKTSDRPANTPRPPEEFRRRGYLIQSIGLDPTISRPFAIDPAAFLIRVKPGSDLTLAAAIHNFKDPAVLQMELLPFTEPVVEGAAFYAIKGSALKNAFNEQISIDCNRVRVASCLALDWVSFPAHFQKNFFLDAGEQKALDLGIKIPENAPQGDYYIKLRLAEFQKPYHYTSTELYVTVTQSGLIDQNLSIDKIGFTKDSSWHNLGNFALIDSGYNPILAIHVANGSPYFLPAAIRLKIRSPLGFEVNKVLSPVVLLANQSKTVNLELNNFPLGPATITASAGTAASFSFFALPYPGLIIIGSAIILAIAAIWTLFSKND